MTVKIEGLEEVGRMLNQLAPVEARRLMRLTVRDVAQVFAEDAKASMPEKTGKLKKSVKAKINRDNGTTISARVDGLFYGRILDQGDGPDGVAHGFYMRAREKVNADLSKIVVDKFARRLVARLMKG